MTEDAPVSRLKRRLASGGVGVGVSLTFPHAGMAEFLGRLGFDCIMIDAQHGPIADSEIQAIAMACDLTNCTLMVRVTADSALIERYMALGVTGIQIPQAQSASQVRQVIEAVKYAPIGRRGLGNSRAGQYGLWKGGFPALMEAANRRTMISVQIEDKEGIGALPEIVRIAEVDAVIVGQVDLSNDLGMPGQVDHPSVVKAVDQIIGVANAARKAAGLSAGTPDEARRAVSRGARFLVTSVSRSLALSGVDLLQAAAAIPNGGDVTVRTTGSGEEEV